MKKVILIVILSIILLLSLGTVYLLYAQIFMLPTPISVPTEPVTYSVTFLMDDTVVSQQTVAENAQTDIVLVEYPGIQVAGWADEHGHIHPAAVPAATADAVYRLVYYPQLTNHAPYLFADDAGLLRPDESLTRAELSAALHALAADGAEAYFPELTGDDLPLSRVELMTVLEYFFPADAVAEALPDSQNPTRSMFAQTMNRLLERGGEELVNPQQEAIFPTDVTAQRTDALDLLEAAVHHTPSDAGFSWDTFELPVPYEPGFVNLDGQLYYVQEDHYFLKDGYVGTLYFDAEGRYTSGDATLDATVLTILQGIIAENPDADRFTLLRAVFEHCYENYTYRRTFDHPAYGSTGWEIQRANAMFESTKGNCYSYAAIFWALSRALGYETRAISGKVLSDEQPHSWCIIQLEDGQDYIFDPQWQYNYIERGLDHDMFKIPMERIGYWLYQWEE